MGQGSEWEILPSAFVTQATRSWPFRLKVPFTDDLSGTLDQFRFEFQLPDQRDWIAANIADLDGPKPGLLITAPPELPPLEKMSLEGDSRDATVRFRLKRGGKEIKSFHRYVRVVPDILLRPDLIRVTDGDHEPIRPEKGDFKANFDPPLRIDFTSKMRVVRGLPLEVKDRKVLVWIDVPVMVTGGTAPDTLIRDLRTYADHPESAPPPLQLKVHPLAVSENDQLVPGALELTPPRPSGVKAIIGCLWDVFGRQWEQYCVVELMRYRAAKQSPDPAIAEEWGPVYVFSVIPWYVHLIRRILFVLAAVLGIGLTAAAACFCRRKWNRACIPDVGQLLDSLVVRSENLRFGIKPFEPKKAGWCRDRRPPRGMDAGCADHDGSCRRGEGPRREPAGHRSGAQRP